MPSIVFVCAIGAFAVNNRMIDIWYMILFGFIGMAFKKLDYPIAPMVLALVLGDMAENAMRQSLVMSQGSPLIFFSRPIAGIVNGVAILFFFWPLIKSARERWGKKGPEKASTPTEIPGRPLSSSTAAPFPPGPSMGGDGHEAAGGGRTDVGAAPGGQEKT